LKKQILETLKIQDPVFQTHLNENTRKMDNSPHSAKNNLTGSLNSKKEIISTVIENSEDAGLDNKLIRFEVRNKHFIWVSPDEIIFAVSADHYVKTLINCGKQKKWMIRHCTLKDLFNRLGATNFIRLNKFYLINGNYISHINEKEKIIFLHDNFSIPVPHRISRYMLDLLKNKTIRKTYFTK
jgi:DNA-binding LytR/AlgR family response regulator